MPQDEELIQLNAKLSAAALPDAVREKVDTQLRRLERLSGGDFSLQIDLTVRWIEWILSLPWQTRSKDIADLERAKHILDANHHGLGEVKERILEYLAVLKLRNGPKVQKFRAPILLFVGLVGTGKTTLASSIAAALGRPIVRIPFGGLGSARDLRGQSRLHPEAEPGRVIKAIRSAGVKNPVLLLDELDRVGEKERGDIMGVLVELLDPEQNAAFLDHYLDVPFDLSDVLFIATANNTGNIATAVMDRLEPISLPSYTDQDKEIIAKRHLLPRIMEECGVTSRQLVIDDAVWPAIIRPLGYDAGIRTLQRTIQGIVRKSAKAIVTGEHHVLHVTAENLKEFVPMW